MTIEVAAIMDTPVTSGPGRQLVGLCAGLREWNVDVRVITFRRRTWAEAPFVEMLRAHGISHVAIPDRGPLDRSVVARTREVLAAWRPAIVQTHSYRPAAIAWWLRRTGASWKWIAFHHGTTRENLKVRMYHALDRRLMRAADRIVVVASSQVERFSSHRRPPEVIANAILPLDADAALPPSHHERLAALPGPRIGVVGRLSREKGLDVLLEALALLAARGCRPSLVIAGDGPERTALEARAAALGLRQVLFLGRVDPVDALYPELDLVVLPSRSEGLPNVLLEALRAGRRVVCTAVGAVPEVLQTAGTGRLVPPDDPPALAAAIMRALEEAPGLPAGAVARLDERYGLAHRAAEHVRLYGDVLDGPGGS